MTETVENTGVSQDAIERMSDLVDKHEGPGITAVEAGTISELFDRGLDFSYGVGSDGKVKGFSLSILQPPKSDHIVEDDDGSID